MIESIKHVKDLIFDSSKSWGVITARLISLFALLILLDMSFNFTYNIHTSNKLNQLEKITLLKDEYKNDSKKISEIVRIEKEIFDKQHYSEYLPFIISKFSFQKEANDHNDIKIHNENSTVDKPIKSPFWMIISSNYLLVFILPFLLFLPLYDKKSRKGNGITGWISSIVFIIGFIAFVTWISYQIPLIMGNPILNYVLNFLLHTLFWGSIIKFGGKKKNKLTSN